MSDPKKTLKTISRARKTDPLDHENKWPKRILSALLIGGSIFGLNIGSHKPVPQEKPLSSYSIVQNNQNVDNNILKSILNSLSTAKVEAATINLDKPSETIPLNRVEKAFDYMNDNLKNERVKEIEVPIKEYREKKMFQNFSLGSFEIGICWEKAGKVNPIPAAVLPPKDYYSNEDRWAGFGTEDLMNVDSIRFYLVKQPNDPTKQVLIRFSPHEFALYYITANNKVEGLAVTTSGLDMTDFGIAITFGKDSSSGNRTIDICLRDSNLPKRVIAVQYCILSEPNQNQKSIVGKNIIVCEVKN